MWCIPTDLSISQVIVQVLLVVISTLVAMARPMGVIDNGCRKPVVLIVDLLWEGLGMLGREKRRRFYYGF